MKIFSLKLRQTYGECFNDVKENIYKKQDNKRNSSSHRRSQPLMEIGSKLSVTTHVLITNKGIISKFVPKWDGP